MLKVGYVLKVFPRLSETFILNEILELEAQGVEVEIFSLHPPADPHYHGRLANLRAPVTYLPRADSNDIWRALQRQCAPAGLEPERAGGAFLRALSAKDPLEGRLFLQAAWLAPAVRARGIGHLHAHFATSATRAAMLAHLLTGVSFSFTAHAKDIYHDGRDAGLLPQAMEHAAFVVTVTDFNVARLAEESPAAAHKVHRIYNGLPLQMLEAAPPAGPSGETPEILAVGRLVEKKGFHYLIDACRMLADQGRDFHCRIIGDGEFRPKLERRVWEVGLERVVTLAGAKVQDAVLDGIRASRFLVLPCIVGDDGNRDALPTVLLEAMALGRPVVSTDLEGVTEIVDDGVTGLVARQADAVSLASAMARLLDDQALAARLARNARLKVERLFDGRRNVAQLAALFGRAEDGAHAAEAGEENLVCA